MRKSSVSYNTLCNGFNQGEKQMILTYEPSTNFWPIGIWNPQPMTV